MNYMKIWSDLRHHSDVGLTLVTSALETLQSSILTLTVFSFLFHFFFSLSLIVFLVIFLPFFFFSIIDLQVPEISSEKLNDLAFLRSNRGLFLHVENTHAVRTTDTERDAEEDGANYTVKDARPTPNEDTRNFEKTTGVAKSNEDSQTSKASYTDGELSDGEEVTRVNCKQFRNRTSVSTAGFC